MIMFRTQHRRLIYAEICELPTYSETHNQRDDQPWQQFTQAKTATQPENLFTIG
jgi:hypothetical protein